MNTTKTILALALVLGMGAAHQARGMKHSLDSGNNGNEQKKQRTSLSSWLSTLFLGDPTQNLLTAVRKGDVAACKHAIQNKANVNATDEDGRTPLHVALEKGQFERYSFVIDHLDIVKLLLDNGANVNAVDKYGSTPLHVACWKDNAKIVELLLKKDAGVNATANDGTTPLHIACQKGNFDIVELLLKKDAGVNTTDNDGTTPLHIACQKGNFDIVKLLLDKGADSKAETRCGGWTPLQEACFKGYLEIVKLLIERGAQVTQRDIGAINPNKANAKELREVLQAAINTVKMAESK